MACRAVLFGYYPRWTALISTHLDHQLFAPSFAALDRVDPERFDAVLPLRIEHYAQLRAARLRGPCRAIIPDEDVIALCDDKLTLSRRLIALGFGAHIPALYGDAPRFPCIAKPRSGEFGAGCRILHSPGATPPGCFLQAFVPGTDEFAIHVLRVAGRIRYFGTVRYVMPQPMMVRGESHRPDRLEPVNGDAIRPLIDRILAALAFEGTCCVNLKFDNGAPMILEINPRFGASLSYDATRYALAYCDALGV